MEELKKDMANFDPSIMCMRNTLPGKGVPAGWQLKGMAKRDLGDVLSKAYQNWPGEVKLVFEPPPEKNELEGLSPRSADAVRLCTAAYTGDKDEVVRLVNAQVDVDVRVREKGNNTPLNLACRGGHIEIMKFLFDKRADPNSRNDFAETPLMCAANRARGNVCRMLLERGADVHALDENGDNALDFLGMGNSERKKDCRDVLRKAGCQRR
eukprot:NODE_17503_length_939_cov_3.427340.p1 GENE.NODE_17503_length_939_cov_3.427340~~NODE_17503_length_939_cov_3.427340.p1  ORF type:complete len:230 (-),score=59.91 NODE_17503_length_939_cov_3.427340:250-879(-)